MQPWLSTMNLKKLVEEAQSGDPASLEELLIRYGWSEDYKYTHFLGKYVDLLWYGKFDANNKESRKLIRLYIKDPIVNQKLKWPKMDANTFYTAQRTANYLQDHIRQFYSLGELKHELVIVFLDLLHHYEKQPGIDFSGYLMGYFRYKVYAFLQKDCFSYDGLLTERADTLPHNIASSKDYYREITYDVIDYRDKLDLFWINGHAGYYFQSLSKLERIILRDWYLYDKTDSEIARNNGFHRNSILNKRHKAVSKLKELIKKELEG